MTQYLLVGQPALWQHPVLGQTFLEYLARVLMASYACYKGAYQCR